jgi:glycerol uptake facilitator-like aquaporin
MTSPLWRWLRAEFLGTGLLVTAVVGSGVMAAKLSSVDIGLELLENSIATMLALTVLILVLGPVSGAHFNPVVSAVDWWLGRREGRGVSARHLAA